jgi:hypothetical protein
LSSSSHAAGTAMPGSRQLLHRTAGKAAAAAPGQLLSRRTVMDSIVEVRRQLCFWSNLQSHYKHARRRSRCSGVLVHCPSMHVSVTLVTSLINFHDLLSQAESWRAGKRNRRSGRTKFTITHPTDVLGLLSSAES